MGASKIHQYSLKQRSFARTAKAIGHPARIAIVGHLAEHGIATNTDFMCVTALCDATVSQHLAELTDGGIIEGLFVEHRHYYRLTPDAEEAVTALNRVFKGER